MHLPFVFGFFFSSYIQMQCRFIICNKRVEACSSIATLYNMYFTMHLQTEVVSQVFLLILSSNNCFTLTVKFVKANCPIPTYKY